MGNPDGHIHAFFDKVHDAIDVSDLEAKGALIWLDRDAINPGQLWQDAIRDAIEQGNFFIACFSSNSVSKRKTVMNEELLIAVSELRKMPYGAIWFIPVLLDHRTVPRIPIGPGLTLHDLQWFRSPTIGMKAYHA